MMIESSVDDDGLSRFASVFVDMCSRMVELASRNLFVSGCVAPRCERGHEL